MIHDTIVIGAGAAGCFSAIVAAESFPGAKITILEKSQKPLAKVKISGGGRCNVTNVLSDPSKLSRNYPRGERFLKKAFYTFSSADLVSWLREKGVELKLYPDGCYFPLSDSSETVIHCFLGELRKHGIEIQTGTKVESIEPRGENWIVRTPQQEFLTRTVIVTAGGQPKISGFDLLSKLSIGIVPPVPSLFTFNLPENTITSLMGIVTEASVKLTGEKQQYAGPLLITHWGMSGPAILKTSAFGARKLAEQAYNADYLVNWANNLDRKEIAEAVEQKRTSSKKVFNDALFQLKSRLWEFLCQRAGISEGDWWNQLSQKKINRLTEVLSADLYSMRGKTTFKEEFVTAGGINLNEIEVRTMQHKSYPGLFFAGEILDIDGITGGFNFQSAWTTAYIAGKSVLLGKG